VYLRSGLVRPESRPLGNLTSLDPPIADRSGDRSHTPSHKVCKFADLGVVSLDLTQFCVRSGKRRKIAPLARLALPLRRGGWASASIGCVPAPSKPDAGAAVLLCRDGRGRRGAPAPVASRHPLGSFGRPEEVALFLASDGASYIVNAGFFPTADVHRRCMTVSCRCQPSASRKQRPFVRCAANG
jgi:hypothetical protein